MFNKPLTDLNADDIQRILDEEWQENDAIELKQTLPAKQGNDPWLNEQKIVGDHARNKLLEEVVAFANARGGLLIIGVAETNDKPARAASLSPLPKCHELADRIRMQCRDCIEPQVALIEVAGVALEDDAGVIIVRVPQSRQAPHRHTISKECYVRRADRAEKMTMREIQDMTLFVERGLLAVENEFHRRHTFFCAEMASLMPQDTDSFSLRVSAVPLVDIHIGSVSNRPDIRPPLVNVKGKWNDHAGFELSVPLSSNEWRPKLRATITHIPEKEHSNYFCTRELCSTGVIEYQLYAKDMRRQLPPRWCVAVFANCLIAIERFARKPISKVSSMAWRWSFVSKVEHMAWVVSITFLIDLLEILKKKIFFSLNTVLAIVKNLKCC